MSDIPIGSPPAPAGRHAAPGGWYPDPAADGQERYWDGWQWSRNTRPAEQAQTQRPAPPHAGQSAPQQGYPQQNYPGQSYAGQQGYPQQSYPGQQGPGQPGPLPPGARAVATADGVRLAGWWWRALAATVDNLLISLLILPVTITVYRPTIQAVLAYFREAMAAASAGAPPPPTPNVTDLLSTSDQFLVVGATLVVGLAFHTLFLRWRSATPGKLLCGLRVVPVDRGRASEKLSWATAAVRAAVWVLPSTSSLLTLVRVADVLFPLWQPRRQALHDLAARTQVVRPFR